MNEDQLRRLLAAAAQPAMDDDVRAVTALYGGKRRVRRRQLAVASAGAAVLVAGGAISLVPRHSAPATDVVLGCAQGVGSSGDGLVTSGLDGVTLAVSNPTQQVLSVSGGGTTVLALPGTTQVTLPIASGTTVRCGDGAPVRLTVQHPASLRNCTSVGTAAAATVQSGEISALTRAQFRTLPLGAVVEASTASDPVRRVQVRSAGRVVAEAVWHEMPSAGDWQLESLSRCD